MKALTMFAFAPALDRKLAINLDIHIEEIRNGNQFAFEKVFRLLYADLCRYANNMLRNQDEAEDLVQNTFVAFWEKRQQIMVVGSLKAYLYKSVYNHCLNKIKHGKIRLEHESYVINNFSEASLGQPHIANELEGNIEKAIEKLPEQCQKIFKMSRFDELKYQEIADILEISVKTVENQIGKALKIMRIELSEYLLSLLIIIIFKI
jgi:RNA polymerase sigma-70 factor (family 1)